MAIFDCIIMGRRHYYSFTIIIIIIDVDWGLLAACLPLPTRPDTDPASERDLLYGDLLLSKQQYLHCTVIDDNHDDDTDNE